MVALIYVKLTLLLFILLFILEFFRTMYCQFFFPFPFDKVLLRNLVNSSFAWSLQNKSGIFRIKLVPVIWPGYKILLFCGKQALPLLTATIVQPVQPLSCCISEYSILTTYSSSKALIQANLCRFRIRVRSSYYY